MEKELVSLIQCRGFFFHNGNYAYEDRRSDPYQGNDQEKYIFSDENSYNE